MKITEIFSNMQALYEMQEQLARMEANISNIAEGISDSFHSIDFAQERIHSARVEISAFLEKLESADVEIEL